MTIRYIGKGGSDSNDGLSWANRKLTFDGVEDSPVAAGDTVYIGPGVYREDFTDDVSGTSGNPISFVGDVSGEHTDGIGGIIRITGSMDDKSTTYGRFVSISTEYRTFRNLCFDYHLGANESMRLSTNASHCIIEDCHFGSMERVSSSGIHISWDPNADHIVRRCIFAGQQIGMEIEATSEIEQETIIEDCLFLSVSGITITNVTGIIIKNCTFLCSQTGVTVAGGLSNPSYVTNCVFSQNITSLYVVIAGAEQIVEDYNSIGPDNYTARANVSTGSNSDAKMYHWLPPLLKAGYRIPFQGFEPSDFAGFRRITGSSDTLSDVYGVAKPSTGSKRSRGAIQYNQKVRETTITRGSSVSSLKLSDAGRLQFFLEVTAVSTTISVYVHRGANYSGTLPRMIIKEDGQSDRVTTDIGSAGTFNKLTDTFTPQSVTQFIVVELVSLNTGTSGDYYAIFEDLLVS